MSPERALRHRSGLPTRVRDDNEHAARLRVLLRTMRDAVLVEDERRRVVTANGAYCDLWGVPGAPESLDGADAALALRATAASVIDPQAYLRRLEALLASEEPTRAETVELRDGRVLLRDYAPVRVGGRSAGHIWVFRDVTEDRRAERRLRDALAEVDAASRSEEEVLAAISHELRSPLTAILGIADLLASEVGPAQRAQVETLRRAGNTLLLLLNDLLDWSKLRAGRFDLSPARMDPRACLEEVVDALAVGASDKRLALRIEVAPDVPRRVVGDALRLRQVLTNLGSNAVKYTAQGEVVFTVTRVPGEADRLRFAVRDTGPGLDEAQRAQLFRVWSRLDVPWSRARDGSGLGLALARELVEAMGGRIGVDSTPGSGSTFWFTAWLPESPGATLRMQRVRRDHAGEITLAPALRVLLAEDDETSRQVLAGMLERLGHEVTAVEDGPAAVEAFRNAPRRYDLLILDVQMPLMDGWEATRRIRQLEGPSRRVPIVALTASAMRGDRERCLDAGMDEHLAKPVTLGALAAVLERYVGLASAPRARANGDVALGARACPATADEAGRERARDPERPGPGAVVGAAPPLLDHARLEALRAADPTLVARLLRLWMVQAPEHVRSLEEAVAVAASTDQAAGAAVAGERKGLDARRGRSPSGDGGDASGAGRRPAAGMAPTGSGYLAVARAAHALRGASLNVGAARVATVAAALERAAHAGEAARVTALVPAVREAVEATTAALRGAEADLLSG